MSGVIAEHFRKILCGDISVTEDYSDNLVCIARMGNKPETLNSAGAKVILVSLMHMTAFQNADVLVNQTTENYGVLTLQSDFAPFQSYVCIAQDGKIIRATLYAYRPVQEMLAAVEPMPKSKDASKIFHKHVRAMFSMKASIITQDYAENGIVITNMAKGTCEGKPQIYKFCNHLMKNSRALVKRMDFHGISSVRWHIRSAGDGLLLFTIEAPSMQMLMTETYWVKDSKIQFESSIAHGAMLDLIHELL